MPMSDWRHIIVPLLFGGYGRHGWRDSAWGRVWLGRQATRCGQGGLAAKRTIADWVPKLYWEAADYKRKLVSVERVAKMRAALACVTAAAAHNCWLAKMVWSAWARNWLD